ncbi:MAG: thioredoxin family protein [Prevotella sp.]|nr:thioredoxin family protein [Prevotella sp.]
MKKNILSYILLLCMSWLALAADAQASYTWNVSKGGADELILTFNGRLDDGWHLSDQSIKFEVADGVERIGGLANNRQKLRITKKNYHFKGYMEYIVCSDVSCLAPQYVEFDVTGEAPSANDGQEGKAKGNDAAATPVVSTEKTIDANDSVSLSVVQKSPMDSVIIDLSDPLWKPVLVKNATVGDVAETGQAGLWRGALIAFLAGLLALLTPCVWPIIPLTVSYFLKRGRGVKDAVMFGICIVGIFILLGLAVTSLFGANAMNQLATNAVFNIVCFLALLLFGLSLIGLFTVTLPSSWSANLDSQATKKGGFIGIFLMALTLVVVSFSCTAPIVGTLLVEIVSSESSTYAPLVGMLAFSLALALPFMLFALFPSMLKRMPRSGVWMEHVKVVLGVLEIAFALKFLSVADMAYGWGILSWRTFLIVWALLFGGLTVYFIVKRNTMKWWIIATVLPLLLTIYLINGIAGGDTKLVSAFMPPKTDASETVFDDYEKGMAAARKAGKKVFLDFTGYGCVNCRKMEAAVFTDERIKAKMSDFIVIRLYVDDRTELPQKMYVKKNSEKVLRTVGDKWSLLEEHKFGQITQPLYAILDAEGNALTTTYSYDEDVEKFLRWLSLR